MPDGVADHLHEYLRNVRASVLRALEDLGEYDARRPLVPSGSNLLGIHDPEGGRAVPAGMTRAGRLTALHGWAYRR